MISGRGGAEGAGEDEEKQEEQGSWEAREPRTEEIIPKALSAICTAAASRPSIRPSVPPTDLKSCIFITLSVGLWVSVVTVSVCVLLLLLLFLLFLSGKYDETDSCTPEGTQLPSLSCHT